MLLLKALERLPNERYDAIVVDEGQDFLPDWWPRLDQALKDGCEGTLYAFYDPNQDIFDGGPPAALEVVETKLVHNCRNTTRIAEYAAGLLGAETIVKAGAPQGELVEEITCDGNADIIRQVGDRLRRLVTTRPSIPPGSPSSRHARSRTPRSPGTVGWPFPSGESGRDQKLDESEVAARQPTRQVVFDTLDRFKGLERDVVILLDLPGGDRAVNAHHRYVAASRAKNLLVVVRPAR